MRGRDGAQKNLVQAICERDIRTILFVVVNARADKQSALDRSATPPGIIPSIVGTTSSAIDGTTHGLLDRLDTVTKDLVRLNRSCDAQAVEDLVVLSVPVDFDFIDDPVCRTRFQNMATSWALPGAAIVALLDAGSAMVARGLKAAPRDGSQPSAAARLGLEIAAGPSLAGACQTAASAD
jgi:hypothetical protein